MTHDPCPVCNGAGWHLDILIDNGTGLIDSRERECDTCHGQGVAPDPPPRESTGPTRGA